MTRHIKDTTATRDPPDNGEDPFLLLPFADVTQSLFALWSLPITTMQIWTNGWVTAMARGEPETDRAAPDSQLPIPNPLQKAKDSDLFA